VGLITYKIYRYGTEHQTAFPLDEDELGNTKTKKRTRSKALSAAWAILQNEDVTIFYLTERYNRKPQKVRIINQMGLFNRDVITNF
jgi:hypothetical protein